MTPLVVCLPLTAAKDAAHYEYVLTTPSDALDRYASTPVELLPDTAREGVVVVVPIVQLSWHRVELPKGIGAGSAKLRLVLEGLLEDRLLDDAGLLHFSLAPSSPIDTGPVWVAVCNKSWLQGHLRALETAGYRVSRVVPEFAPSMGAPRVHVIRSDGQPHLVITGSQTEGVISLPLTPQSVALTFEVPDSEDAEIFSDPELADIAEELLLSKVNLMTRPQRLLEATASAWDLAQFELSSSGRLRFVKLLTTVAANLRHAPEGRPARWGVALLLVVHIAGVNAWSWHVQSGLQTKRAAIANALTATFPQVKLVVDAPLQMEREVTRLRQESGGLTGRDFEPMLAALGSVVPADKSFSSVEFTLGELKLKGLQLDGPDASRVSQQLERLGYAARSEGDTFLIQQRRSASELR